MGVRAFGSRLDRWSRRLRFVRKNITSDVTLLTHYAQP